MEKLKQNKFKIFYAFRSVLFYTILAFIVGLVLIIFWPFIYVFPKLPFYIFSNLTRFMLILMRGLLGIKIRFENTQILQDLQKKFKCFIIAPKHQSEVETLIFSIFMDSFKIIYKKEVQKVPIISHYMKCMNFIPIDRKAGKKTVQDLINYGEKAVLENCPLIIFPEGTRMPFGKRGHYHAGVALMYKSLDIPILPVAHNAGAVFPSHVFTKYPGTITFRFLEPILPGKDALETLKQLEERIEYACENMAFQKLKGI